MASRQESVKGLFATALAMVPGERAAFLENVGRANPRLRKELESLLREYEEAGSFLEKPFAAFASLTAADTRNVEESTGITSGANSACMQDSRFSAGHVLAGRFLIVRFIARGGMGEVYEVEDRLLQKAHVALKVVLPQIGSDPDMRRRFEQEVLLARQIIHPNLCPIYDIFHCRKPEPAFSFLTMKLLTGESLAARLAGHRPLPPDEAAQTQMQLISGLAAVHAAGIVHRDIKPNNVMLHGEGAGLHLWIMDFGLARMYEAESTVLTRGGFAGTPGYIAPELVLGHPPSQASDIFALGVVLHRVFTGEHPLLRARSFSLVPSSRLRAPHVPCSSARLVTEFLSDDLERRCRAFQQAQIPASARRPGRRITTDLQAAPLSGVWTRRRFLVAASGASALAAAGIASKWDQLDDWMHPLPVKRFVALLIWPPAANSHITAILAGVIDAIEQELSRVEASDHNFFIMASPQLNPLRTTAEVGEAREAVGANLVLAASGIPHAQGLAVSLAVLDPSARQPLRQKQIECVAGQEQQLPYQAARAAAELLDVARHPRKQQSSISTTSSPSAYAAFQRAEALRKQENDTGLDEAIESYKRAAELDPQYAMAYAKLSLAYGRHYAAHRDSAALSIARRNYETALALAPDLIDAHLAKAMVLEQTGDGTAALHALAKALSLDPNNPRLLLEQAQIFNNLNRWPDAEQTFQRILKQRPNYWQAYNELGAVYSEQGKYHEALDAFRTASLGAPKVALEFANIAIIQLALGQATQAIASCSKSLSLGQNAFAAEIMGAALRYQRRFDEAIVFAKKAIDLDPTDPGCWFELGDCYSSMHDRQQEAAQAYSRGAQLLEERLMTVPNDGAGWMLLALCRAEVKRREPALAALRKADALPTDDLDSQMYKARMFEVLGMREESLATLRRCFDRGSTDFQVQLMPDLKSLRADARYAEVAADKIQRNGFDA